jgi:hypothetical protein
VPIDTSVPYSPGWWMHRLVTKLTDPARQTRLELLDSWYTGEPPLPVGAENAREAYRAFQRLARSNFAELVVEAVRERMRPVGIRTSADGDETGDAEAWRIWQRAGLDVESAEVHRTALALGDSYVIIGDVDPDSKVPVITAEDPRQVITEHDPVQQRRIRAALKMFDDDLTGQQVVYVYLPGRVFVARSRPRSPAPPGSTPVVPRFNAANFDWDADLGGEDGQEIPAGLMPVVRFRNRRGVGEFEPHIDLLGRINHMVLQRMMIATLQAFRQRAVKGLPLRDEAGDIIDYNGIFSADPGALWQLPEGAEMWESGQVDLAGILNSVRADVQNLAAVTRTPLHMLDPGAENQSAEGAALAREGLVFKVEDQLVRASGGWSLVLAAAFAWMGDGVRADLNKLHMMWASPQRYSLAEQYSAASQARGIVPTETIWSEVLGFGPDQVARAQSQRADEALLAPALNVPPAPVTPAAVSAATVPPPAG